MSMSIGRHSSPSTMHDLRDTCSGKNGCTCNPECIRGDQAFPRKGEWTAFLAQIGGKKEKAEAVSYAEAIFL
jgi:hypothetical protein